MAVMADFARMPGQRKVLIFVLVGALIGVAYRQFVYSKLGTELDETDGLHAAKVAMTKKLDKDLKDFTDLKPQVSWYNARITAAERMLPKDAAALPVFWETINRKVAESGVTVIHSQQRADEPVDQFVRTPVDFEIQGSFMQLKRFFASFVPRRGDEPINGTNGAAEERDRIVSFENLAINDPEVRNHEIVLTAKFTAMTFRQEEKKDDKKDARPTGAGGGGAGGAGAGAGSATPSAPAGASGGSALPPAATPAGAKARVDNAMQKEQERADGVDKLRGAQ